MSSVGPPPIQDPMGSTSWHRWWKSVTDFVATTGSNFSTLDDTSFLSLADGDFAVFETSSGLWKNRNLATSGINFIGLPDTPASYSGQALLGLRVNSGETAVEFAAVAVTFLDLSDSPSSYSSTAFQK